MSVTDTSSQRPPGVHSRDGVTDATSDRAVRDASRNARLEQLMARMQAENDDIRRRAESGDEHAKWLRSIGSGNVTRSGAEFRLVRYAQESACWCARCGRDVDPAEAVWWDKLNYRGTMAPVCVHCVRRRPDGYYKWLERQCVGCGRTVHDLTCRGWAKGPRKNPVCSERCAFRHQAEIRSQQRADARMARPCEVCGELFTPPRSDGRYCKAACRQKAYRRRNGGAP